MTKLYYITLFTIINIVCLVGYFMIGQRTEVERLNFLVKTFEVETNIQDAQIYDMYAEINKRNNEMYSQRQLSYQEGFESGKTQMGISFLHGGTMEAYSDGYHAALSQWGPVDPQDKSLSLMLGDIHKDAVATFSEIFHEAIEDGQLEEAALMREIIIQELDSTLSDKQDELIVIEEGELLKLIESDIEIQDEVQDKSPFETLEKNSDK